MAAGDIAKIMGRRSSATGTAVAAVGMPYTFQRTFMTRSNLDQALVTGLSFALSHAIATGFQETIQSAALLATRRGGKGPDVARWSRATIALDLLAVAGGLVAQRALQQRPGEKLTRGAGRTAGQFGAIAGTAGTVIGGIQHATGFRGGWKPAAAAASVTGLTAAQREWHRRRHEAVLEEQGLEPSEITGAKAIGMGAGVAVGSWLLGAMEGAIADRVARGAARILPGGTGVWRPAGHAASLGLILMGLRSAARKVFGVVEGKEFAVEPAIDVRPLFPEVSGGPGSLVDFRTLAKMGRRFVWTLRSAEIIERVLGEEAAANPIRVYVGLKSAPTTEERVALAIAELERTGAFDRSWLMITTPTGTGYANYAAAGALEFLSLGDCANVAMQYAARPSPISLDRVSEGRKQARMLIDAIKQKLDERPPEQRPRVVLFGESLGAWSSQDAFMDQGTQGLIDAGIDHAVWIGTPNQSKWKEQVLRDPRPDVDRSLVGVFNDLGEWEALTPEERERIRYVMITHYNDGVAYFGASVAVQAPEWLGDPETRPPSVPRSQRWIPVTSFVQGLIDTKNAARVVPGVFDADGHDYRGDLVPFLDVVLGFGASEERRAAIVAALESEELRRTRWIKERGKVGESMAATIVDRVRAQDPEAFERAVRAVEAELIRERDNGEEQPAAG
jgi:uncharacterized membrane protein